MMKVLELCAGGGGQALGLDLAGYEKTALIEIEKEACLTLQQNRPQWNVINADLKILQPNQFKGVDVICGGVPCQPFSIAGQKLGKHDERDLFPIAINYVAKLKPAAFFFENVKGLSTNAFSDYRNLIVKELTDLGYYVEWKVLEASDYGVPQLRPRFILVGKRNGKTPFPWPQPHEQKITVSEAISDLMGEKGWRGLKEWKKLANQVAPTLVGGSRKHGGPDLGPTRAKRQWAAMGVDGMGIGNEPPDRDFVGIPKLTNRMAARIQGFPDEWIFAGKKTAVYRQIGNAFPPPVAQAVAESLKQWILTPEKRPSRRQLLETEVTL